VKDDASYREASADPGAVWGDAHRAQLQDVIHAIRTGQPPLIDGPAGRAPVQVIQAVYQSARTGKPVSLDHNEPSLS
jgi:predicted dehydrogenase